MKQELWQDSGGHPDEIVTASWIEGGLAGEPAAAFEAHLAECGACRAGVRILRESAAALSREESRHAMDLAGEAARRSTARAPDPAGVSPVSRRTRPTLAAAATLVAAAALAIWWGVTARPRATDDPAAIAPPVFRLGEAGSPGALSPGADEVVDPDSLRFSWSPVAGATRYEVVVMTAEGETLLRLEPPDGETRVGWSGPLPPSGDLLWKVRALALDRVVAESMPILFHVR